VLDSIERYGRGSVETLALGFNDPDGPVQEIAQGARLADRALAVLGSEGVNGKASRIMESDVAVPRAALAEKPSKL
jgi:hypothetical protein